MTASRHRLTSRACRPALPIAAVAIVAAALTACGGGGSDAGASGASSIDDATATAYSANSAYVASDAADAADTALMTAQAVIGLSASSAGASAEKNAAALQAQAAATYDCPGGGTATVSISGGNPARWTNGQLDAGEAYRIAFAACKGALGWRSVDGSYTLTVDAASGDNANGTLALTTLADNLSVASPRGGATLNGGASRSLTVATDANGSVHWSGHYVASQWTLATRYNLRNATFTLTGVDIAREATVSAGMLQSASISGGYTLAATLPRGAFSYTVATTSPVVLDANGVPVSGGWTILLPDALIAVSIANNAATWTLDKGKDGTIDRTIVIPLPQLQGDAG